ncbi:hypothetical protein X894_192 [Burkholderia pseudomallei MSHR4462]|nr:hypothetical protein X894_192 [Burkholderia pseudomallei MSHR4462]
MPPLPAGAARVAAPVAAADARRTPTHRFRRARRTSPPVAVPPGSLRKPGRHAPHRHPCFRRAHARTRSRKHRSPHRKWPVRSTRRSTPTASDARIQRVLRRRFRFAPGHDGRRDAGTQRLTSARAVKRIARVDPYRKVGAKPRRIDVERPACATARQRFIRRPPASRSRGARSPQGQRQRPRRADERRAARCGGDPSRREVHGMRMGRL